MMPHTLITSLAGLAAAALAALGISPAALDDSSAVRNTPRNTVASQLIAADGNNPWTSTNWSGYAVARGTYTQVSATWTVPAPEQTSGSTYSSIWIGIDGFNNTSLIQVGTEQDYVGSARYYVWWEILPATQTRVGMAVNGGDQVTASIARVAGGAWTISMVDKTSGQSFSTTQSYNGPLNSAEWIVEAPNIGNHPADLAHYGQTTLAPIQANDTSPGLTKADAGIMVQNGKQVSTPSDPGMGADRFAMAYGSQPPPAPFL
jgi:Peptidase A4 family